MSLTDEELLMKLTEIVRKACSEGRITEEEANRIIFYGTYHNECVTRTDFDWDEKCCPIQINL